MGTGPDVVALLNRHLIIVVPSRWQEPFGLVALEGIACGCVALGANCGGLPNAIGGAGATFLHEDVDDAACWIERLRFGAKPIPPRFVVIDGYWRREMWPLFLMHRMHY